MKREALATSEVDVAKVVVEDFLGDVYRRLTGPNQRWPRAMVVDSIRRLPYAFWLRIRPSPLESVLEMAPDRKRFCLLAFAYARTGRTAEAGDACGDGAGARTALDSGAIFPRRLRGNRRERSSIRGARIAWLILSAGL